MAAKIHGARPRPRVAVLGHGLCANLVSRPPFVAALGLRRLTLSLGRRDPAVSQIADRAGLTHVASADVRGRV